ncbi:MAG: hypothetical protein HZT39_07850 [Pseudoxanthomonas sp.]|nr:MAG: hypothetical protein HZT39_07850 [Pseudoxanthomonas sp.]
MRAAFITDVFLIDVLTELLTSPLHLLSYIARRTRYGDRLMAAQEMTILGYHLRHNLWFDDEQKLVHMDEGSRSALTSLWPRDDAHYLAPRRHQGY